MCVIVCFSFCVRTHHHTKTPTKSQKLRPEIKDVANDGASEYFEKLKWIFEEIATKAQRTKQAPAKAQQVL